MTGLSYKAFMASYFICHISWLESLSFLVEWVILAICIVERWVKSGRRMIILLMMSYKGCICWWVKLTSVWFVLLVSSMMLVLVQIICCRCPRFFLLLIQVSILSDRPFLFKYHWFLSLFKCSCSHHLLMTLNIL